MAVGLAAAAPLALKDSAAQGLTATEFGVGGLAVLARRDFVGGTIGVARRVGNQTRLGVAVAGGGREGYQAMRLEATVQFLVTPAARGGAGLYGGAGLAWAGSDDAPGAGFLVALLGLEAVPGRRSGWYVEVGVAGGVRAAAGWRWRRFPGWWR